MCDPCFRCLIPESSESVHIVPPFGKTFITGLASSYTLDSYNPELLSEFITDKEYAELIDKINSTLIEFWPCTPC